MLGFQRPRRATFPAPCHQGAGKHYPCCSHLSHHFDSHTRARQPMLSPLQLRAFRATVRDVKGRQGFGEGSRAPRPCLAARLPRKALRK